MLSSERDHYVYIVGPGGRVQQRPVTTGDVSEKGITILSGLSGKEQVVLSAGAFLSPGDRIVPELRSR